MKLTKRAMLLPIMLVIFTLVMQAAPNSQFRFPEAESFKAMQTNAQIVAALQIPENILKTMSTEELVTVCLDYPLHPDVIFYNTQQRGMEALINQFNGLRELLSRKDAGTHLMKIFCVTDTPVESLSSARIGEFTTKLNYMELLLAQESILNELTPDQRTSLLEESVRKLDTKLNYPDIYGSTSINAVSTLGLSTLNKIESITPLYSDADRLKEIFTTSDLSIASSTITTPCGTVVPGTVTMSLPLTPYEQDFYTSYIDISYPSSTVVGASDSAYNCHGYAWEMAAESPYGPWSQKVSIQTTQPKDFYVSDGSYSSSVPTTVVTYSIDHSAVPEGASQPNDPMLENLTRDDLSGPKGSQYYISKWGGGYLMRHLPTDVPAGYGSPQGYYGPAPAHTVNISGAASLTQGQQYTYSVTTRGGCTASPTYSWSYRRGSGSWISGGTGSTLTVTMQTEDITVRVYVTKGTYTVFDDHVTTLSVPALSVSISGPTKLWPGMTGTFTAVVSGGSGTTTYTWYHKSTYLGNGPQQSVTMGTSVLFLKVTVVKGSQTVTAYKSVKVGTGPSPE